MCRKRPKVYHLHDGLNSLLERQPTPKITFGQINFKTHSNSNVFNKNALVRISFPSSPFGYESPCLSPPQTLENENLIRRIVDWHWKWCERHVSWDPSSPFLIETKSTPLIVLNTPFSEIISLCQVKVVINLPTYALYRLSSCMIRTLILSITYKWDTLYKYESFP